MKVLSNVPVSRSWYKTGLKLYENSYTQNLENLELKSRDQNYHQMAEQYTGHVSPPVSRDHYTALPLVDYLVKLYGRINNIMH